MIRIDKDCLVGVPAHDMQSCNAVSLPSIIKQSRASKIISQLLVMVGYHLSSPTINHFRPLLTIVINELCSLLLLIQYPTVISTQRLATPRLGMLLGRGTPLQYARPEGERRVSATVLPALVLQPGGDQL